MRFGTGLSLAANVAVLAAAGAVVRRKGLTPILRALRPEPSEPVDYARIARERFTDLPGAPVVLAGDSMAQNCPAAELFGQVAVRGIGGMTITDLAGWIDLVLDGGELGRLVLWIGTNNVLLGHDPAKIRGDFVELLERITVARPDVELVVLSVPPLDGHDVTAANGVLSEVAAKFGARFVDLTAAMAGPEHQEADGVHLTPRGYATLRAVAPLVSR